ncbi:MAG TPA: hypothetical protein VFY40_04650 [Blastocatellia bacterium]|nr:hypothetical protein [Blastocatellia bacterium]
MPPTSFIAHQMPGRTRIRIPAMRRNDAYFQNVQKALQECNGVAGVETNPLTASVLVYHFSSLDKIKEFAEGRNLFLIEAKPESSESLPSERISAQLKSLDQRIMEITGGRLDGKEAAFSGLLLAAAYQVFKGSVLPAGATLVWYALILMTQKQGGDLRG